MAWYQRNYLKFILWIIILIIISIIIPIQILIGILFYIFYFVIFFYKFLKLKFNYKNIKNINYKRNDYNNIYFIFIKFFLWDLPKKKSFFFFYNTIKYVYLSKNKKSILILFKNYNLLFKLFKKFLIVYLFRLITTFSLLSVKNTNFVYHKFLQNSKINLNNYSIFFSTLILNLMFDYNEIEIVENKQILFNEINKKVEINPKQPIKETINAGKVFIKNTTDFNIVTNDLRYSTNISMSNYNTSSPFINCTLKLDDNLNLNTISLPNNNVQHLNVHSYYKENYILKSQPHLEKINKDFLHNQAGFKENGDFLRYIDKKNLIPFDSELKYFIDTNINEFYRVPVHLVETINQNTIDCSKIIQNFNSFQTLKYDFAKDILKYWDSPILIYKLDNNNNLILNNEKITLGNFLLNNKHNYSIGLSNTIDTMDIYFEKNKDIFSNLNLKARESFIDNTYVPNNLITKIIYNSTKKFEKGGSNMQDFDDVVDFNVIVNNLVDFLKK